MERDFFDNAFDKAKSAFEVAYKKTGEVLSTEKLKFNVSTLKSKREKLFAKLGKNYFLSLENFEQLNEDDRSICDEIVQINEKIDELNNEINYAKSNRICPSCGAVIDETAVFCSKCGEKLVFDSSEE
ncbi:MAG: zinc-ribbon domain-containing protein [Clostridia bacterium]|nr:zinc-ribbon domain-containing protein [Clostridia bacterium]